MIEAARTSETSVDIYLTTRQYIPEDSELHTRRRENLKSHMFLRMFIKFDTSFSDVRIIIKNKAPKLKLFSFCVDR
jgi:hypothetical protein